MPAVGGSGSGKDAHVKKQLAVSEDSSDEDIEYHGQYVLDLSRALSELGSLYQDACEAQSGLPGLDQLMGG